MKFQGIFFFQKASDIEHFFSCTYCPILHLILRIVCSIDSPIDWIICSFVLNSLLFLYIQTIISFAVQKCFNFVRSTCQLLLESRVVAVLFGKPLPLPIYWNISFYVFLYHLQWTKDFNVRPEIAIYFWFFFSCLKIKIPRVFFKNDTLLIISLQIFSVDGCSLGCQLIKNDTETYY